jgi:hypothetical protein
MKHRWLWAAFLAAALPGCGLREAPAVATRPEAVPAAPAPEPIQVITDAAALNAARKLAATRERANEQEELETQLLLSNDAAHFERLRRHRERVIPLLRHRLGNDAPSARWARVQAAFQLRRLKDPQGTAAARRFTADPALADAVLSQLHLLTVSDRVALPGIDALVMQSLESNRAGVRTSAIEAAVQLKSPALDRKLVELIRSGRDVRGRGAYGLSQRAPSAELLDACVAGLRKAEPDDRYWWLSAVAEHGRVQAPTVSGRALEVCAEFLDRSGASLGMDGGSLAALEALEKSPGARATTLLERLVHNSGASAQVRGSALHSLARRDRSRGREVALDLLTDPDLGPAAVDALGEAGRGTADLQLVQALDGVATRTAGKEALTTRVARALLAIGGGPALEAAGRLADRVPPRERTAIQWAQRKITPEKALARLAALKLLDARAAATARKRLLTPPPQGASGSNLGDVREVSDGSAEGPRVGAEFVGATFALAGLLTSFDTETGELPVRHDRLLRDLAAHSGGAFKPEAIHEQWEQKGEEDEDAPYTVQFLHSGRLYRFRAQNLGDWYDVAAVLAAANRALADAGVKQRFLSLPGDGQVANVACLDPVAYARAARELFLPEPADPDAARRDGKAFEGQVLEEIRKGTPGPSGRSVEVVE